MHNTFKQNTASTGSPKCLNIRIVRSASKKVKGMSFASLYCLLRNANSVFKRGRNISFGSHQWSFFLNTGMGRRYCIAGAFTIVSVLGFCNPDGAKVLTLPESRCPSRDRLEKQKGRSNLLRPGEFRSGMAYHFNAFKRRATSSAFARLLKDEMRKKPSPLEPKPLPGVMTTFASFRILSKACQLV